MRFTRMFAALAIPLTLLLAAPLRAQEREIGIEAAELPVDRIADLLALETGVTWLGRGDLNIRGAGTNTLAPYIDGVPIRPGHRGMGTPLLGGSWFGARGSGMAVGTNAFTTLTLSPGLGGSEFGMSRGGTVQVRTLAPRRAPDAPALGARASWATDAILGTGQSLEFNRLQLNAEAGAGAFAFNLAGTLEGQGTARLGMDQNHPPAYLANGVDTTVTVNGPGGPTQVDVLAFRPAPGLRTPASAASNYALLAKGTYQASPRHRIEVWAAASQDQARQFGYQDLYNPVQLRGSKSWSRAITGAWYGSLSERAELEVHLSRQADRVTEGPLSVAGESETRSPWGGFMVGGFAYRFDGESFPVNDQLIRNFRTNTGRRSPYDLNAPTQYQLIDEYRNNAYGLLGFSDRGGPVGLLRISEEDRTVAKAVGQYALADGYRIRAGADVTRYDLRYYSSPLTSQALAEAYVEAPRRLAGYASVLVASGELSLDAGVRYDHFRSGADRPGFPRISSSPGFDPANPAAGFVTDKGHGRLSPTVRGRYRITPRAELFASLGQQVEVPDFALVFAGINTDLSTTTNAHTYGTDLGFERARFGEVGALMEIGMGVKARATLWNRSDEDLAVLVISPEFDPARATTVDIKRYVNGGRSTATGFELQFSRALGAGGAATIGYTYTDANEQLPAGGAVFAPADAERADVRRHVVTAVLRYETGPESHALGGLVRNTGVSAIFRAASGTRYSRCTLGFMNNFVLSDDACVLASIVGEVNGSTTPAISLLDVKLSRSFRFGGAELALFADARNLLNTRNVLRVFAQNGQTRNPQLEAFQRDLDLTGFAVEAARNGVLQPDSSIDLSFGGALDPRGACGSWVADNGSSATPNCVYLIGAETRFGNGDHIFTPLEQARASTALYQVAFGQQALTGSGRRLRVGMQVRF